MVGQIEKLHALNPHPLPPIAKYISANIPTRDEKYNNGIELTHYFHSDPSLVPSIFVQVRNECRAVFKPSWILGWLNFRKFCQNLAPQVFWGYTRDIQAPCRYVPWNYFLENQKVILQIFWENKCTVTGGTDVCKAQLMVYIKYSLSYWVRHSKALLILGERWSNTQKLYTMSSLAFMQFLSRRKITSYFTSHVSGQGHRIGAVCVCVDVGVWELRCASPTEYRTTLCTIDLRCVHNVVLYQCTLW